MMDVELYQAFPRVPPRVPRHRSGVARDLVARTLLQHRECLVLVDHSLAVPVDQLGQVVCARWAFRLGEFLKARHHYPACFGCLRELVPGAMHTHCMGAIGPHLQRADANAAVFRVYVVTTCDAPLCLAAGQASLLLESMTTEDGQQPLRVCYTCARVPTGDPDEPRFMRCTHCHRAEYCSLVCEREGAARHRDACVMLQHVDMDSNDKDALF